MFRHTRGHLHADIWKCFNYFL